MLAIIVIDIYQAFWILSMFNQQKCLMLLLITEHHWKHTMLAVYEYIYSEHFECKYWLSPIYYLLPGKRQDVH